MPAVTEPYWLFHTDNTLSTQHVDIDEVRDLANRYHSPLYDIVLEVSDIVVK